MKNLIVCLTSALILAGCASQQKEVEAMATLRAEQMNALMPVDIGKYKFLRTKANGALISVDILYGGGSAITPSEFLRNSVDDYCINPVVRPLLDKGISYHFTVRDARGRAMSEQLISQQSCAPTAS